MNASTPHQVDRIVEQFFEIGPDYVSDRVLDAIAGGVRRTPQRSARASWELASMPPTAFALVAVVLVAGIGLGLLLAPGTRPAAVPPASSAPSSTPSPPPAIGALQAGRTYRTSAFALPFTFTVPNPAGAFTAAPEAGYLQGPCNRQVPFSSAAATAQPGCGAFRILTSSGAVTFHYASVLPADLCRPQDGDSALPQSLQAVGTWLTADPGMSVTAPSATVVDGHAVLSWDVTLSSDCWSGPGTPPGDHLVWFNAGEHHRVYAVATAGAPLIVLTWSKDGPQDEATRIAIINAWADQLVASLSLR